MLSKIDKKINNIKENEEYKHNQMVIDTITKVLIEYNGVSQELVEWLKDGVRKNTILEYDSCKD